MKSDIYIEPIGLEELIAKLEQNNKEICTILSNVNKDILLLDETKWRSIQKMKFDEVFHPYLVSVNEVIPIRLTNCTTLLHNAINKYNRDEAQVVEVLEDVTSRVDDNLII